MRSISNYSACNWCIHHALWMVICCGMNCIVHLWILDLYRCSTGHHQFNFGWYQVHLEVNFLEDVTSWGNVVDPGKDMSHHWPVNYEILASVVSYMLWIYCHILADPLLNCAFPIVLAQNHTTYTMLRGYRVYVITTGKVPGQIPGKSDPQGINL